MPSQREYKNFPKQIWNFYFSSFADCKKIYRYNISLFSCSRFSHRINKSYFYRFTAINFAKQYWRTYTFMIPFIPNPADKSGGSHRDNHHFQWTIAQKERTARNTPDSFCRRFTRQNHRCAAWAVFFFYGKRTLKISWADRTWYRLFVNAAAQTGVGTSFGANGDPHTWAAQPLLIFAP